MVVVGVAGLEPAKANLRWWLVVAHDGPEGENNGTPDVSGTLVEVGGDRPLVLCIQ